MTTLNFDELLSPEDAFDNAMRRKLDHIAMIMMWAKQMQTEGRLPPDVAKAMDDYFSGADAEAIQEAEDRCFENFPSAEP